MGKLTIDCSKIFSSLAIVKPTIKINGISQHSTSWGLNTYNLQAGTVQIIVSRPWTRMLPLQIGIALISLTLEEQDVVVLKYKEPNFFLLPGKLSLVSQTKTSFSLDAPHIEGGGIPNTCPHCKNPNTKKIRLCEWCGGQIV